MFAFGSLVTFSAASAVQYWALSRQVPAASYSPPGGRPWSDARAFRIPEALVGLRAVDLAASRSPVEAQATVAALTSERADAPNHRHE